MQKVIIVLIVCLMLALIYVLNDVIHAPYEFCNAFAIAESVAFAIGMGIYWSKEYRR